MLDIVMSDVDRSARYGIRSVPTGSSVVAQAVEIMKISDRL